MAMLLNLNRMPAGAINRDETARARSLTDDKQFRIDASPDKRRSCSWRSVAGTGLALGRTSGSAMFKARPLVAGWLILALACSGCGDGGGGVSDLDDATRTPIKHLIIVLPENRSFDNVFATYTPPSGQTISNLLSRGIVNADGTPGPNFSLASQMQATDTSEYEIAPTHTGPYATLPPPGLRLAAILPPGLAFPSLIPDPGLDATSQELLLVGSLTYSTPSAPCTPDTQYVFQCLGENFDTRYPAELPNGPYQITGSTTPYYSYFGDPPHRFFQNWQQVDCSMAYATALNPSGCKADLFAWVDDTVGPGGNGDPNPSPTYYGGVALGYYNMALGDFPYLLSLAQRYAISDNYHQSILGGTAVNHHALMTGDLLYYSDGNGNPIPPPAAAIENPDPVPGTDNWYTNDGDAGDGSSGAYVNCSDLGQPGVAPIMDYLGTLPYQAFNGGNCAPGTYYLVNNEVPAFGSEGAPTAASICPAGLPCIVPPSTVPTIGDALSARDVSWKYYGEGFDDASNPFPPDPQGLLYEFLANAFQYSKSIMTTSLRDNIQDLGPFFDDVQNDTLPAVSFVKPDGLLDGHPGSSSPPLAEAFIRKIVDAVQANAQVWEETAIIVVWDESGGYYDSGYVQPIDFFGDGPRVPFLVVSPFAKPGSVDHTYADHASILKFIEYNWGLAPLSSRSRDNLPNPTPSAENPYVPTNSPAIGDLRTLFDF
jgi:phospholipase C